MAGNTSFEAAKANKNDEFYTKLDEIEKELKHYRDHFKDKHVFLNCDDPEYSNFWRFFYINFDFLGLKHLTATHYNDNEQTYRLDYYAEENGQMTFLQTDLEQNGDFRSPESLAILKECDIVVTNPPFSLFREYMEILMEYDKSFLIIGNQNNVTYKEMIPLLQEDKIWLGVNSGTMEFQVPNTEEYHKKTSFRVDEKGHAWRKFGNICWYTNLDYPERHEDLILYKSYNPEEYPKYVNFDAIEVGTVKSIPFDYKGNMGVPITFLKDYNPDQFKIVGFSANLAKPMKEIANKGEYMQGGPRFYIKEQNGKYIYKRLYDRVVIKKI